MIRPKGELNKLSGAHHSLSERSRFWLQSLTSIARFYRQTQAGLKSTKIIFVVIKKIIKINAL